MTYKVIDLFSGVGGLSYPFHRDLSFEVVAANEMLEEPAKAYSLNNPETRMYIMDIHDFSFRQVYEDIGVRHVDIVLGGPPCQSYSTAGKRDMQDPRTELFKEYCRILEECSAKMFIFENVRGMMSMKGGALFKGMVSLFKNLGYIVQHRILNAAEYGVPQMRERVIVVGTKDGLSFDFPEATHGENKKPFLTVANAIGDLPFIGTNDSSEEYAMLPQNSFQRQMRNGCDSLLRDHSSPKNNKRLLKIMELLPDGGTPRDLPKELRPTSGFGNTYCRLWWNKPSTTITRNLGTPSSARCIHPKTPRPLTTREGARLQSFPDNFVFYGSRGKKNLQVGEAVPPLLSGALLRSVKNTLNIVPGNDCNRVPKHRLSVTIDRLR